MSDLSDEFGEFNVIEKNVGQNYEQLNYPLKLRGQIKF